MKRSFVVVAAAALLATACATAASAAPAAPMEPVTVSGVRHADAGLTFEITAMSGGCTRAEDFSVEVVDVDRVQHLRVVRLKPDVCEAFVPSGATVTLSTTKLTAERPIVVDNLLFVAER